MAIKSGIAGQLGIKAESIYGTPVTVDRFYEFNSEGIAVDVADVFSRGIGTGRFQRSDRFKSYIRGARGPINMDVLTKGFGLWFEHMLGQNTVTGAGADKTHTCIPDANALQGKSLTVQVGRPDVNGTVRAYTYEGGKILDWELACALDEQLKLNVNMDFENVLTATALASASYPSAAEELVFSEGAFTIDGNTQFVKSFNLRGNNALNAERRAIGNVKREPVANAEAVIDGSLEMEFEDLTRYAAWVAGDVVADLVLLFESPTVIPTTSTEFALQVTLPAIKYMGETPMVGGPDIVMQNAPFKALYNGTDPIIELVYTTSDTAP